VEIIEIIGADYKERTAQWHAMRDSLMVGALRSDKAVISDTENHLFRGVRAWMMLIDGEPVSLNITNIGKSGHNIWRPNANWYTAYTRVDQRRQGFAKVLATVVRDIAVKAGCRRLRSKAGTILGVRLHQSMGDQFWALTAKHELLVDTPISPTVVFPNIVPPDSKPGKKDQPHIIYGDKPLTPGQIEQIIASTTLAYDRV
jgi:hypothetical protein